MSEDAVSRLLIRIGLGLLLVGLCLLVIAAVLP